jgi:hypothetical protein
MEQPSLPADTLVFAITHWISGASLVNEGLTPPLTVLDTQLETCAIRAQYTHAHCTTPLTWWVLPRQPSTPHTSYVTCGSPTVVLPGVNVVDAEFSVDAALRKVGGPLSASVQVARSSP